MNDQKKKRKKRRIRLRTLFLLAITLASNSFAWFVYSTKVSNNITARVKSWHVNFEVGSGEEIEEYLEINIDSLYPGMTTYTQTLTASNSGEARAQISYEVIRANILGDDLTGMNYSDIQIINYLRSYYPFSIDFHVSNDIVQANSEETVTISVSWPYESGQDEEDTKWGNLAYIYHSSHPDTPSIDLSIKITAYQIEE